MSGGRGLIGSIFRNFINSLKPRQRRGNFMGKDQYGTLYYEIPGDPKLYRKTSRWFEPKEKDNFQQELPAEWESWLRFRRKEPPTEVEVLTNAALSLSKKVKAAELEGQRSKKLSSNSEPNKQLKGIDSFPKYDEYEIMPGLGTKEQRKKD